MHIHCKHCDWEQTAFWTKDYNPIKYLQEWEKILLTKDVNKDFTDDKSFNEENGRIPVKEQIARLCEEAASEIRGIHFKTLEDFEKSNKTCPDCYELLSMN